MKVAGKNLALLLLVGILLASCAGQAEGSETPDINSSLTAGVGTIVAYFFETQTAMAPPATVTPSITPLPLPSGSPIALPTLGGLGTPTPIYVYLSPTPTGTFYTSTPNSGSLAYGCNNLLFIRDEETPNGTDLRPNQSFTRTWKVANNGTCNWLFGFRLVPVSGYAFAEDPISVHNAPVVPGEWREFSVSSQAPEDGGTYTQYWQLSDGAGHTFGSQLSISIDVVAPTNTPQPTKTNTPLPSNTAVPAPTITGITPNNANVGDTVGMTITGSAFVSGTTVSFEGGTGTPPQVTAPNIVNSTSMQITVTVDASSDPNQIWNVKVTNPTGSAVLSGGFTVNP